MNNKRIVIFGGGGFIGRHLVRPLARAGWQIAIASRRPERACQLRLAGVVGQIVPLAVDVRDAARVHIACQGADAVVNLVGILYPRRGAGFDDIHVGAAKTIAQAAQNTGVKRLVHVSALGADSQSASAYQRSKAAGEEAVRGAFESAAILRPSLIFGHGDGFFCRFASLLRISPTFPLIGGGGTRFQPVYVGDVAKAIETLIDPLSTNQGVYQAGGPDIYTFKQMVQMILATTGMRRLLIPLPWPLANTVASVLEVLPVPILTRDQVASLRSDNIMVADQPTIQDLGVPPTSLESMIDGILRRFNRRPRIMNDVSPSS
ncbi:MAG: complex I NDUFA9 subunit family protein [Pseudomonadota bacterium]